MKRLIPFATAAVVIAAMVLLATTPDATLAPAPQTQLADIADHESVPIEASEAERTTLPADTHIEKRRYTARDGAWHLVSLVIGGSHKGSIHRPELCLPAQGFLMLRPHTVAVGDIRWRFLTLAGEDGHNLSFSYTFFNQDGFRTSSHIRRIFRDVWDRTLHNRIDRWAMVTVVSSSDDEAATTAFLAHLRGILP